jgi:hypothetical protein
MTPLTPGIRRSPRSGLRRFYAAWIDVMQVRDAATELAQYRSDPENTEHIPDDPFVSFTDVLDVGMRFGTEPKAASVHPDRGGPSPSPFPMPPIVRSGVAACNTAGQLFELYGKGTLATICCW